MPMEKEVYIARQSLVSELLDRVRLLDEKINGQQELLDGLFRLQQSMQQQENKGFAGTDNGQRERRLARAVQEAISGLEQSRKSFKSKQLEQIRHNLIKALAQVSEKNEHGHGNPEAFRPAGGCGFNQR